MGLIRFLCGRWLGVGMLAVWLAACGGGGGGGGGTPDDGSNGQKVDPIAADPANQTLPRIEPYEHTEPQGATARIAGVGVLPPEPAMVPAATIDLGPLPAPAPPAGSTLPRPDGTKARPIGLTRGVAAVADVAGVARRLAWQPLPGGGLGAALRVRSPGAAGLRLAVRVERLPAGTVLQVTGTKPGGGAQVPAAQVLATLARDAAAGATGRLYWLPAVAGDEAVLQVNLPEGAGPEELAIALPEAAHLWWTHAAATRAADLKAGEAGSCNLDARCSPDYDAEQRSIARLEFIDGNQAYLCTGTLVADTAATGTPWMLTANHCIGNQAAASTVSTYWFYRAAACGSDRLDPAATQRHGGATLLHATSATDTAFLRLEQALPVGTRHAGLLLGPVAVGTEQVGLHHPGGDLLKLSLGTVQSYATCIGTLCDIGGTTGEYLAVNWRRGTTESGSSGSALFVAAGGSGHRYVAGHLFAGLASCTALDREDFYGRIDLAYPALRPYLGTVPGT